MKKEFLKKLLMPTPFLIAYFVGGLLFFLLGNGWAYNYIWDIVELSLRRSCCCASVDISLFRMWTEGGCGELKH